MPLLLFGNPFFVARIIIVLATDVVKAVVLRDAIVVLLLLELDFALERNATNAFLKKGSKTFGRRVSKRRSAMTRKGGLDDDDANDDANDDKRWFQKRFKTTTKPFSLSTSKRDIGGKNQRPSFRV